MITHDCTKQVEVIAFIQEEGPSTRSGWFLDRFFRDRRTDAEKLEYRKYTKTGATPLFYTGACLPPNLVEPQAESVQVRDMSFPVIKAEGNITGCDVEERKINPDGTIIPVGRQRFETAVNWQMMSIIGGLRATHISEAISILRTGGYILHSSNTEDRGTVDFGRADELKAIDLVGTSDDWGGVCASPAEIIDDIVREMSKRKGIAGTVDIIYSTVAWRAMRAHMRAEAAQFNEKRDVVFETSLLEYDDVSFAGSTKGGMYRHWISTATHTNHKGEDVPVLEEGEIMIVSANAFDGQRVYRTVTSDNKEKLPAGAKFFLYDGEAEYEPKCRAYKPWIEEYHLMVPTNVNAATVVRVVSEDFVDCMPCGFDCDEVVEPSTESNDGSYTDDRQH